MRNKRNLIIGALFILWGLDLLLPIDLPIGKIALGTFFCYIGFIFIFGKKNTFFHKSANSKDTIFNASDIKVEDKGEYNVIFGSSDIVIDNDTKDATINVVFGSSDINILTERPLEIKAEAVFSSVNLPNGNHLSFGDNYYKADGIGEPLKLKISTVFGSTDIKKI